MLISIDMERRQWELLYVQLHTEAIRARAQAARGETGGLDGDALREAAAQIEAVLLSSCEEIPADLSCDDTVSLPRPVVLETPPWEVGRRVIADGSQEDRTPIWALGANGRPECKPTVWVEPKPDAENLTPFSTWPSDDKVAVVEVGEERCQPLEEGFAPNLFRTAKHRFARPSRPVPAPVEHPVRAKMPGWTGWVGLGCGLVGLAGSVFAIYACWTGRWNVTFADLAAGVNIAAWSVEPRLVPSVCALAVLIAVCFAGIVLSAGAGVNHPRINQAGEFREWLWPVWGWVASMTAIIGWVVAAFIAT